MRYSELVESVDVAKIKSTVVKYFSVGEVTIDNEGFVSIDGSCINQGQFDVLPVKFKEVSGHFICSDGILSSLAGSPVSVGSGFNCSGNKLTSLVGGPVSVVGNFVCRGNQLVSLVGLPQSCARIFFDWSAELPLLRLVGRYVFIGNGVDVIQTIINAYKGNPSKSNIVSCQNELIAAGFAGNEKW